jgi:hypothetical protein
MDSPKHTFGLRFFANRPADRVRTTERRAKKEKKKGAEEEDEERQTYS